MEITERQIKALREAATKAVKQNENHGCHCDGCAMVFMDLEEALNLFKSKPRPRETREDIFNFNDRMKHIPKDMP